MKIISTILFSFSLTGVIAVQAVDPVYPLKISENKRYFVDQNRVPVLLHGDTAWSLIVELTKPETEQYLENRRQKGFNTVLVNLIEHKFGSNVPRNRDGEPPFTTPGDFSTPNENYFTHVDWILRKAAEKGIQALLAPDYLGYAGSDEGWYEETLANGANKLREYGRYVGRRYKDFDNIIWLMGGDRNPEKAMEAVEGMALGIRETDPRHLFTAHTAPEFSPVDVYPKAVRLDVNATYTYKLVHDSLLRDYNRKPVTPFFLIESTYEGEHNASPVQIRRQAYWAVLCGGAGHILGNRPIWLFASGWQAALEAPGSMSMTHLKALFDSRPWHDLIPDAKHKVVTGGLGEFNGLDYLAAARTSDGGTLIAYLPTGRTVTVDLSTLSGESAKAWWFNPRMGKPEFISESPTQGLKEFSPPSTDDWVLVLDDAGKGYAPPGTKKVPNGNQ